MGSNDNRALISAKNLKTAVRNFLQVLSHILYLHILKIVQYLFMLMSKVEISFCCKSYDINIPATKKPFKSEIEKHTIVGSKEFCHPDKFYPFCFEVTRRRSKAWP